MVATTIKHALEQAARFSGLHKSQCSKMLQCHPNVAVYTLESLSKKQARQVSKALHTLKALPWKIAIVIESTLQPRASLMPANAQTLNHGQGFVIGPQWTNIVLLLHDILIPLRPIPFYSQRYCRVHALTYRSEHDLVVDYLEQCELEASIGADARREVIVLTDSGYDDTKMQQAIAATQGQFLMALHKTRRVTSQRLSLTTPKAKQWCGIAPFFCNHRGLKGKTIGIATHGTKRKRMEFRIRDTIGSLRYVGQVPWVCSERRKRPEGRRTY
jgi:hypothetical protein